MKKLVNLNGAKALTKNEQKTLQGGKAPYCTAPEIACYDPINHGWSCVLPQYCGDCWFINEESNIIVWLFGITYLSLIVNFISWKK